MDYLYIISGFILLLLSGKYLVAGSVSLAFRFKVSTLVIGVTIVSFGTSMPELMVSLKAALSSHHDIAVGNVIGSNISNIALVLAATAAIYPLTVNRNSAIFDWPVMMIASIFFYLFAIDFLIGRIEGVIFIIFLIAYLVWSIYASRKKNTKLPNELSKAQFNLIPAILIVMVASVGLMVGADLLVKGAVEVARTFEVSERVISITLIALGTSLPELATSLVAAFKKEMDISVGNIIGSNIFNILAVLGISSIVKPIRILDPAIMQIDMIIMLAISLLLFIFMLPFKNSVIGRWKGGVFLIIYFLYIAMLFWK